MRNLDYGVKFLQFCRLTKIIIYNMSMKPFLRTKGPDIAFAIVVMALGAVSIVEGLSIRPSRFDPLGPGAVPAMIEPQKVNVDFPAWVVFALDREADRLGVPRQSLIKVWIVERLEKAG